MKTGTWAIVIALAITTPLVAQQQTVQDEYALYDLQAPQTGSFRTIYDFCLSKFAGSA